MTRFAAHRTAAKIYDETSVNASGEGPPPYGKDSVELEILEKRQKSTTQT